MPFYARYFKIVRDSLVFKVVFVVVGITVLAVVVILIYSTYVTRKAIVDYNAKTFDSSLNNYATTIDQKLFNLQGDVAQLAKNSLVLENLPSTKNGAATKLNNELKAKYETTGPWEQLLIANPSGNIVALQGRGQEDIGKPVFTNSSNCFAKLHDSNNTVSVIQTENGQGNVCFLQPIVSNQNGSTVGYIGGVYALNNLNSLLNVANSYKLYLYDNQNQLVLTLGDMDNPENESIVLQARKDSQNSSQKVDGAHGNIHIIALPKFSSGIISELGLGVVGSINNSDVLHTIDEFRKQVYLAAAIALLVVNVILILYLRRLITKPLDDLRVVAQKIAAGQYQERAKVSNRSDDIGRLQYAINDMAMSLINEHFNLESKVSQQTQELSFKITDLEKAKRASVNILEDLAKAKNEVEQSRNKDEALLSSIGDGVFALDADQRIILFNQQASHITGYSEQEVLGKRYDEVLQFEIRNNPKSKAKFIEQAMAGHVSRMPKTTYVKHKSGRFIPVADSSSPVMENSKVIGVIVVFRDITRDLEVETAKNEFVSLASHQLRTPLTAIGWYTELLLKDEKKQLSVDQVSYLKEVAVGNKRMIELVNALLNLSRLELGTVSVEPKAVQLEEVIKSVEAELDHTLKSRHQKLTITLPKDLPVINSDPQLIRIVIQNLVSNAVKYTPNSGHIEVKVAINKEAHTVATHRVPGNSILLSVKDTGYGIPKQEYDKIFTKLYRASNIKSKNTDGTGLGLYIVKMLCDILKTKIWFTSHENQGTTFYLSIPVNAKLAKSGSKGLE